MTTRALSLRTARPCPNARVVALQYRSFVGGRDVNGFAGRKRHSLEHGDDVRVDMGDGLERGFTVVLLNEDAVRVDSRVNHSGGPSEHLPRQRLLLTSQVEDRLLMPFRRDERMTSIPPSAAGARKT